MLSLRKWYFMKGHTCRKVHNTIASSRTDDMIGMVDGTGEGGHTCRTVSLSPSLTQSLLVSRRWTSGDRADMKETQALPSESSLVFLFILCFYYVFIIFLWKYREDSREGLH
jgi:hypothetical protein